MTIVTRKSGQRDNEAINSFEQYNRLARWQARRSFERFFPTFEDRQQAAALAACEAMAELGETTLKLALNAVKRSLYQQARQYGMRQEKVKQHLIKYDLCFCEFETSDDGYNPMLEFKQNGAMVGEYTRLAAYGLHRKYNSFTPEKQLTKVQTQQREILKQMLNHTECLQKIYTVYQKAGSRCTQQMVADELGLCRAAIGDTLERARKQAAKLEAGGQLPTSKREYEVLRQEVTQLYNRTGKGSYLIAAELGIPRRSVTEWLQKAREAGELTAVHQWQQKRDEFKTKLLQSRNKLSIA